MIMLVLALGCTGRPAGYPETAPVEGTVLLDGKPLEGALVIFSPAEGRASRGTTDAAGKYTLRYTGEIDGAMIGSHVVSIVKEISDPRFKAPSRSANGEGDLEPGVPDAPLVNMVPNKYRGRESALSANVTDDQNVFDFDLTSK